MSEIDSKFYDRADAHITLANQQISDEIGPGKVSASLMYANARFAAWISAMGWENADQLAKAKAETIDYFVAEYTKMLEENLDDYIKNFEPYMQPDKKE